MQETKLIYLINIYIFIYICYRIYSLLILSNDLTQSIRIEQSIKTIKHTHTCVQYIYELVKVVSQNEHLGLS